MEERITTTTPADRLHIILKISGYQSIHQLADALHLRDHKFLTLIAGGRYNFSTNIAHSLSRLFPPLTVPWIMHGEHLRANQAYSKRGSILLSDYNVKVVQVYADLDDTPRWELHLPQTLCRKATFGYLYPDTTLEPYCTQGDFLLLKEAPCESMERGLYYIETTTLTAFGYLRPEPGGDTLRLVGLNDRVEDRELEKSTLRTCYQVCGVVAAPCQFPMERIA